MDRHQLRLTSVLAVGAFLCPTPAVAAPSGTSTPGGSPETPAATAYAPRPAMRQVRARTPATGQLIRVPGMPGRQHLWCEGPPPGPGVPTVVVVSGAGDFSLSWRTVQRRLSGHHRVCTYDRAGLGWSSASPTPRTARHIVPQLGRLLKAGDIRGPLAMVGHSMGAIYARMFTDAHPSRVRSMVLVDPGDEHLNVDISAAAQQALSAGVDAASGRQLAGARVCATGAYARHLDLLPLDDVFPPKDARTERRLLAGWCRIWRTNAAEGQGAARTWSQARALHMGRHSLAPRPVGVMVSDADLTFVEDPVLNREIVDTWRRLQRQQLRFSPVHRFEVATGSSHAVMLDRPGKVAAMIRWSLSTGRG